MTEQIADSITIHAVTDIAPDTAWVHTHGMAKFDSPDLEWYWSPAATCGEAGELLNKIAAHIVEARLSPDPGDVLDVPGERFAVQFAKPFEHEGDDYDGNSVLRVQKLTTGEEGVRAFRDLVSSGDSPSDFHCRRAASAHLQGRFIEAWLEYEKALLSDPENVYALANAGQLLLQHGDAEGSLPFFHRAAELAPDYALAHNSLGNAYFVLGQPDEALAEYGMTAELDPDYAMPHRNLALTLHQLGRVDEAIEEARTYFRLAPAGTKDADAHFNLGLMLEEGGSTDEAIEEYERALADDPRHAKALNNLGLVHFSRGEIDEAAEFYRRALEADEGLALARYNLGLAFAARGEHQCAVEEFERVLTLAPDNVPAASNLGVLYTTLGRNDDAIEIFARLVAAEPTQPTLRFNLAMAYQGKGLSEKAESELREVIKLEPPGSPRAERARREMASVS